MRPLDRARAYESLARRVLADYRLGPDERQEETERLVYVIAYTIAAETEALEDRRIAS